MPRLPTLLLAVLLVPLLAGHASALQYRDLTVQPDRAHVGDTLDVQVIVMNPGDEGRFEVNFVVDANPPRAFKTLNVQLSEGEAMPLAATYVPVDAGNHRFIVGDLATTVVVTDDVLGAPSVGVVGSVAALAVAFVLRRGRR